MNLRAALLAFFVLAFASEVSAAPIPLWVRKVSSGGPPPTVPLLGPDGSWTGTPQSVPTDPTRLTAKPSIHWQKPSDVRLNSNVRLCVDADAFNSAGIYTPGISSVDIGNGSTSVTAAFVTNTYANRLDGSTDSVPGYCVDVNAALFKAISTTGSQNFWARANPSDGTMQARVIGGPQTQSGYDTFAYGGNYIMTLYPRTTDNDTSVTVCGSGGATYTTLKLAFDALRVTSFEAPLVTITCSGTYDLANAGGTERSSGQRLVLTVANSVVAVVQQPSGAFTFNNSATWDVRPGWDGMEFRGNGAGGGSLTFDGKWLRSILFTNKAGWFNGVYITNSSGTADSLYWNGNVPPAFGASSVEPAYMDDVVTTYQAGAGINARYAANSKWSHVYGDIFTQSAYMFNNWTNDYDNSFQQALAGRGVTIRYTDPGGHTTATVERSGTGGAPGTHTLTIKVDGVTICARSLGFYSTDSNPTVSTAITDINANCANVTATLTGADRALWKASSIGGDNPLGATNIYNTNTIISVGLDPHAEWVHTYTGGNTKQNATWRNNRVWDYRNAPFINDEATNRWDYIWAGNTWDGSNNNPLYVGSSNSSHYVFKYNGGTFPIVRMEYINGDPAQGASIGDNTYSRAFNNAFNGAVPFGYTTGTCFPNSFGWVNNVYPHQVINGGTPCPLNGPLDSGNIDIFPAASSTMYLGASTGDFRPSSTLTSNQMLSVNPLDGRVLPFAATDVAGAWSKNDPAP